MRRLTHFVAAVLIGLLPSFGQALAEAYPPPGLQNPLSGTITGTYTLGGTPTIAGLARVNGVAPRFALRQDGNQATVSGQSGYVSGEISTLGGGTCPSPPRVQWLSASTFATYDPGVCSTVPADPVTVSSTTGSGTGASFTFANYWGPIAADVGIAPFISSGVNGAVFYPPSLGKNGGSLGLGNTIVANIGAAGGGTNTADGMGGGTGMTAAAGESSGVGYNFLTQCTSCNWLSGLGHHVFGHETTGSKGVGIGTDTFKWTVGSSQAVGVGVDNGKFLQAPSQVTLIGGEVLLGGQFISAVSNAVNNGSGLCRLTVGSTTGMLTGDPVYVTGIVGATACNNVAGTPWTASVVNGTTLDLTGSAFSGTYTSGGSAVDYSSTGTTRVAAGGYLALNSSAYRSAGFIALWGSNAGKAITTARDIAGLGESVFDQLTTGVQNAGLGSNAGHTISTGAGNFFGGFNSDGTANSTAEAIAIGGASNGGGAGAKAASTGITIGARGGNASLTGRAILFGYKIGNTNCTSGNDVIEIFTNAGDCSAVAAANEIQIGTGSTAWLKVTGTNTVTTAVPTIHGLPVLPDVATGTPAASLCLDSSNNIVKKTTTGACI